MSTETRNTLLRLARDVIEVAAKAARSLLEEQMKKEAEK
jgi:hypothetical protein